MGGGGRWISFWDGLFSGTMSVLGRVKWASKNYVIYIYYISTSSRFHSIIYIVLSYIGAWFQYGISPSLVPHVMDNHPIIHPLQAILMVYSSCRWHIYRYCIYTWNLEMSSILVVESSKTRSFPIKTGVIWVPGICSLQALPNVNNFVPLMHVFSRFAVCRSMFLHLQNPKSIYIRQVSNI